MDGVLNPEDVKLFYAVENPAVVPIIDHGFLQKDVKDGKTGVNFESFLRTMVKFDSANEEVGTKDRLQWFFAMIDKSSKELASQANGSLNREEVARFIKVFNPS